MIRVDWIWFLPVAALLGVLLSVAVVLGWRRRRRRLRRLGSDELVPRLTPASAWRAPATRATLLGASALLAGVAFAGPRWGEEQTLVRGSGVDVVLALDASLSMLATDEQPNRLERMKQEVRRLRAQSGGDRIALLAFAGRSYILTPLTVDDGAIDLFLDNLDPSVVGQAGSSLARTIAQGIDLLQATPSASDRALIVMSDGEAFEPEQDIVAAAARAAEARIALITVGFGTEQGSTIPIRELDQVVPKRDENGAIVISKYHPELLRAAATAAQGTFIDASVTDKAARVRQALLSLRGTGRAVSGGLEYTRRFQLFLLPAFLLLLLDTWLADRRSKRRTLAVASFALLLTTPSCAWRTDYPGQGTRAYRARLYPQSAAFYRQAYARGERRPEIMYNLGTALVSADSNAEAVEPLERSAKSERAELRFRSLFNAGLAHLKRGSRGDDAADSTRAELSGALEAYKRALLMRSADADAKWNYELALRKQKEGGGGGGGGGNSNASEQPQPDQPQKERPSGGLGQQQAEQLLNSAARDERGVQGKKQKQSRLPRPPGGKDW